MCGRITIACTSRITVRVSVVLGSGSARTRAAITSVSCVNTWECPLLMRSKLSRANTSTAPILRHGRMSRNLFSRRQGSFPLPKLIIAGVCLRICARPEGLTMIRYRLLSVVEISHRKKRQAMSFSNTMTIRAK